MSTTYLTADKNLKQKHTVFSTVIWIFFAVGIILTVINGGGFRILLPTIFLLCCLCAAMIPLGLKDGAGSLYRFIFLGILSTCILIFSAFVIPYDALVRTPDGTKYVSAFHIHPFWEKVEKAPPLKGALTLKQMDMDAHVVREDERAWFLVTVMYEVKDPHALTASEWDLLKRGTLPLDELPLSFDAAPDQVVETWLRENLPHVAARVRVEYQSPPIVWP